MNIDNLFHLTKSKCIDNLTLSSGVDWKDILARENYKSIGAKSK